MLNGLDIEGSSPLHRMPVRGKLALMSVLTGAMAAFEAAIPAGAVAGTRYDAAHMASLDSERPAAA